ncbi:MAG: hypothetical protein II562_00940 [Prevotella sp.]|nr:hypothetical protein [Prevotella sp.]
MKKQLCVLLLAGLCIVSCDKKGDDKAANNMMQLTSAELAELQDLRSTMDLVAASLDSIDVEEGNLFLKDGSMEKQTDRKAILEKISAFRDLLARQKEQIENMDSGLKDKGTESEKMRRIIRLLNDKIAEKDKELDMLYTELQDSKKSIEELQNKVTTLNVRNTALQHNVNELVDQNAEQEDVIVAQDHLLNQAFLRIGTKKELQESGILSKGNLFKKSKIKLDNLSREGFRPIDIRRFKSIDIPGKKVKVLTPAPEGSYSLTDNGGSYTLQIIDANAFWSVSNYLVIQAD